MYNKIEIRKLIKSLKSQIPTSELIGQSVSIVNQLLELDVVQSANAIMAYYPLPDELDIRGLLDKLCHDKRILLPVIKDNEIFMKEYHGDTHLKMGYYNILEPNTEEFVEDYMSVDVVIVPGVAFTRLGCRLGRGKGFYDRFLPKLCNAYKIGVCYDFQVIDTLPTDSFDQKVDRVISL